MGDLVWKMCENGSISIACLGVDVLYIHLIETYIQLNEVYQHINLIKDDSRLPLEVGLKSELRKASTEVKGSHVFLNMVLADKILISGSLWLKYMMQHEINPINTLRWSSSYSLEHNLCLFLGLLYDLMSSLGQLIVYFLHFLKLRRL